MRNKETQIKALQVLIFHLGDALTFAEIGRRMGFSRQRAYQYYQMGIRDIRQGPIVGTLSDLLDTMPTRTIRDIKRILIERRLRIARKMLESLTRKDT